MNLRFEPARGLTGELRDRKSTRLNSSHGYISYAVFCLKKKKHKALRARRREGLHRRAACTHTLRYYRFQPRLRRTTSVQEGDLPHAVSASRVPMWPGTT